MKNYTTVFGDVKEFKTTFSALNGKLFFRRVPEPDYSGINKAGFGRKAFF